MPQGSGDPATAVPRRLSVAARRGFTLLEILMVLALIALLAGLLVSGATRLLAEQPQSTGEAVRKAIAESRRLAVEGGGEVSLSYDKENRTFTLTAYRGGVAAVAATQVVAVAGEFNVEFLVAGKGGAVLIGGVLVETATVPAVSFFADGTCLPFRVQMTTDGETEVMAIDPWTCAPILERKEAAP